MNTEKDRHSFNDADSVHETSTREQPEGSTTGAQQELCVSRSHEVERKFLINMEVTLGEEAAEGTQLWEQTKSHAMQTKGLI